MMLLAGCASPPPAKEPSLLVHHGPVYNARDIDVLSLSPEMQAFLGRYVTPYDDRETRLQLMLTAIKDDAMLGFDYRDDRTLSAAEAFATRSGNCISFANLVVAMSRAAGLDARFQEVVRAPEWASVDDTLLVARHINVVVHAPGKRVTVDVRGVEMSPDDRRRVLTDAEALGLFYTNLGAEALLDGNLSLAYAWLVHATRTSPGLAEPWINLGVVYGRNRQFAEAIDAYRRALTLDPDDVSALSNLYGVYETLEDHRSAEAIARRVEKYRQRNPYHLLYLGEEAMEEERYADAVAYLGEAIEKKPEEHRFHFGMARALYLSGETVAAEASLERARERAPAERLAFYDRPMAELAEAH